MNSFVTFVKKEASSLNMSPSGLVKASGINPGNWYHWKKGTKPNEDMKSAIKRKIEELKTSPNVLDSVQAPVLASQDKTLPQLKAEKEATIMKLQNEISMIDSLMA